MRRWLGVLPGVRHSTSTLETTVVGPVGLSVIGYLFPELRFLLDFDLGRPVDDFRIKASANSLEEAVVIVLEVILPVAWSRSP